MCFGGTPKPKPMPAQEKKVEQAVSAAKDAERMRQRAASGYASTMLTGTGGVTSSANTQQKTLLGM